MIETPEQRAKRFAAMWYSRMGYARDEATLAAMLSRAMYDIAFTADVRARTQIAARLAELTR